MKQKERQTWAKAQNYILAMFNDSTVRDGRRLVYAKRTPISAVILAWLSKKGYVAYMPISETFYFVELKKHFVARVNKLKKGDM